MSQGDPSCCKLPAAPVRDNPPGESSLRYRIGDQSLFLQRMVARLSRQVVPPQGDQAADPRPLGALTTRAPDDGTIAILDAFACVCDVLTFYLERGFNEGFLPTAQERRSVFEIARSLGYRPGPGVAASTRLAFTIDEAPGAVVEATIPVGTAVMSVPGPDQQPQTFETTASIGARPEWNVLRPAQSRAQVIDYRTSYLYLAGVATRLAVGDAVVVLGAARTSDEGTEITEAWDLRFVVAVQIDHERKTTWIELDRRLGDHENMPDPPGLPRTHPAKAEQRVLTFRDRGSLFGHAAPDFRVMNTDIKAAFNGPNRTTWPNFSLADDTVTGAYLDRVPAQGVIDLDREYPQVVEGSWVCLQDRTQVELFRVNRASPTSRTDFTLTAKCTRLFLDGSEHLDHFGRRSTVVHLASEELALAEAPWDDDVQGQSVELDRQVTAMPQGREVMVRGVDVDSGEVSVEVAVVQDWQVSADGRHSVLVLSESLVGRYRRDSVQILGNITTATHGETVAGEHLGSGDAAAAHQAFALRQQPLTYVPAATPSGGSSTLEVRVDGMAWHGVDALYGAGPKDRVFELRVAYDGTPVVQFGDGKRGARVSTGAENVVATYRKGGGLVGEVDADTLTLLRSRPLGVRGVTNPRAATGAGDSESLDDIRHNAPLTVLTLDRLVSLQDYEDFARAFAGVGKARAVRLWDGKRAFVHVTVASASGKVLAATDETVTALKGAFDRYRDPTHVVVVGNHVERKFSVGLRILPDPDLRREDVAADVVWQLQEAFSFATRDFGQPVAASDVTSVVHRATGVMALDLESLQMLAPPSGHRTLLSAALPGWDGSVVTPAELLTIDAEHIDVGWMS